jgi:arginyl-tRNA--protein-N-Asp/Glu arginylyltransferase
MLVQTASIYGLKRSEYDDLLSKGWFRGNGIVYRSEVVCIDSRVYGIRNIRFPVSSFYMRRSHRKLFAQNQKKFTIRIGTPQCDEAREKLYQGLKSRFKAFVHETLEGVLLSPRQGAEFDAMEIAVYKGDELIAVSYVDVGDRSMASILCIYSQKYSKCSLGKYTMLLEMDLAKRLGLDYYYPGYVLDEPTAFDYKLELGSCQWLSYGNVWCDSPGEIQPSKADNIRRKMDEVGRFLKSAGYHSELKIYPYYTLGHLLLERPDLVRVPSYYTIDSKAGKLAVAYDLQMDAFICFDLNSVTDLDFLHSLHLSKDYAEGPHYELEPKRCTFFHRIRPEFFEEDLHHIIQLLMHANMVIA